jgi:hypothetical protein
MASTTNRLDRVLQRRLPQHRMVSLHLWFEPGLEKTQILLKKPAGRLNAGFSGKTAFFIKKMSMLGGQNQ